MIKYKETDLEKLPEYKKELLELRREILKLQTKKEKLENKIADIKCVTEFYLGNPYISLAPAHMTPVQRASTYLLSRVIQEQPISTTMQIPQLKPRIGLSA